MNDASSNPNADAEAILKAAMGFSVAERAACLAGACGNSAALREKVEAMILAREAPTVVIPKHPPGTILVSFADETAGSVIGRYKLLQQIGEGG